MYKHSPGIFAEDDYSPQYFGVEEKLAWQMGTQDLAKQGLCHSLVGKMAKKCHNLMRT